MINPAEYTITVRFGEFDGENCFEAKVRELPDVSEYADIATEAYELAIDTIETTAEIFAEKGKEMPAPATVPCEYSGRVTLRLAKSLHQALALQAEDEGVSLNQHLVNVLSYNVGFSIGRERAFNEGWSSFDSTTFEVEQLESTGVQRIELRAAS